MTAGDEHNDPRLLQDQCKDLLAEQSLGVQADADSIRARLNEVAAIEARITAPYNRGEVALARGRRALLAGMVDVAVPALDSARDLFNQKAFRRSATHRRVGDCAMLLALAYAANHDFDSAVDELRRAQSAYLEWDSYEESDKRDAIVRWTDATTYMSSLLIHAGRYGDALCELQRAEGTKAGHSRLLLARIGLARARILAAQGQYEAARRLVSSLEAGGDRLVEAEIAGTRGVIRADAGRHTQAINSLWIAKELFSELVAEAEEAAEAALRGPSEDDLERLGRLRTSVAVCEMNLGAISGAAGDHPQALTWYESALARLEMVPLAAGRVIECRMNIGVEAMATGDLPRAEAQFSEVEKFFANQSGFGPVQAGCTLNVGRLRDLQGRHLEAQDRYRAAREAFLRLGLVEWAARCGLNLGSSMFMAQMPCATEEFIPAMLVLDRMRFQFPTAGGRRAWRQTIAGANQLAFTLACDDPHLIAELIENTINSGVHSATLVPLGTVASEVELHDRLQLPQAELARIDAATANRFADSSGTGALIAGAMLPMHPPPRIRLHDKTILLQCYHELGQAIYGPQPWVNDRVVNA